MSGRDLVGGLAAVLIGTVYLRLAADLRSSALDDTLGPGGMPRVYGVLTVVLGAAICIGALFERARAPQGAEAVSRWRDQGRRLLAAAGLLCFGIAYLLLVETLGYLLSIALLLIGVSIYQGAKPGVHVMLVGVGGALALWLIFVYVMDVAMPPGALGLP